MVQFSQRVQKGGLKPYSLHVLPSPYIVRTFTLRWYVGLYHGVMIGC